MQKVNVVHGQEVDDVVPDEGDREEQPPSEAVLNRCSARG
jgi:hypothetical protein